MSGLPLASAAARASLRRAAQLAAARRALALAGMLAAVGAVGVGLRVGSAVGTLLEPTLADPAVTRAIATGLGLVGLGAGIALGVTTPGLACLGARLACTPAAMVDRVAAVLVPPLCFGTLGAALVTLPLAAPIVATGPAGGTGTLLLVCALIAAMVSGGAVAAAAGRARGLLHRAREAAALAVLAPALLALDAALVARTGDALAGRGSPALAIALSLTATGLALTGWGALVIRPAPRAPGRRRSRALRGGAGRVIATAALLLLVRRADVRAALVGGTLLGLVGLGIARLAGAPAPSGLLLAVSGAALTAAPCPLALAGILVAGRHVWRLAPVGVATVTLGWLGAATAGLVPSVALALAAVAVDGGSIADLGVALGMALVVWSCALAAGSILPWRSRGVGDQALSLAATGAAVGGVSLTASRLGPALVDTGLPSPLVGLALVGSVTLVAAVALLAAVRRGQ